MDIYQQRLILEIIECEKDYSRYEVPCDWNNISCTTKVQSILEAVLTGCNHEHIWEGCCDKCSEISRTMVNQYKLEKGLDK